MKNLFSLSAAFICILFFSTGAFSQNASSYFPAEYPAVSVYQQEIKEVDEEPADGPPVTITLTEIEQVSGTTTRYSYTQVETGENPVVINFFTLADTMYSTLGEIIDFDFLDELGVDLDIDLGQRVDIMRLSAEEAASWILFEESISIPLPDEFAEFIPDDLNVEDEMDINISLVNIRLGNTTITTPYGTFDTVVFKPALNVEFVIYVNLGFVVVEVPLTLLENYGAEFYFAEDYGPIRENLEPEIISVNNSTIGIDEEIERLPGNELLLETFEIQQGSSTPEDTQLARAVTLHQNYPNPFNPTTQLSFELHEPGNITLRVFDIQGRLAAQVLQNTAFATGYHTVPFDAAGMASGQYIYTLDFTPAGGAQSVRNSAAFTLIK